MSILIKNGLVITHAGSFEADVLIEGERVSALGARGSDWVADEVIDAAGKYVVPGGIDVHTHMELPFGGTFASDSFETGTRAAAWGGTTTIIDFAVQSKGSGLMEGWEAWMAKAEGNCAIDYGFHLILSDVNDQSLKEMDIAIGEGVSSFKMFMAYPGVFYSTDGEIFRAMQKAAENGATVMMHAENGIAIDVLIAQALERGETDPLYHGIVRKSILEGEATHRAIKLAELAGSPLYIVHLSALEALAEVTNARDEGLNVFAETCPQYLFLDLDDLGNGFEGAKFVCSPPLRDRCRGTPGSLVVRVGDQRPPGRVDRSLPVLLRGPSRARPPEEAGRGRLLQDPQRATRGRASGGVDLPRRGQRGTAEPGTLGRGVLDYSGPDVRPVPAQGDHRRRGRRRHRDLRSEAQARPFGRNPPHANRLLLLRGDATGRWGRQRAFSRPGDHPGNEYRGSKGDGKYLKRELNQYLV